MDEPVAACTIAIIIATSVCSWVGFRDPRFRERLIFAPIEILAGKQYYRMISSALLHADWGHLLLNMVSLFLFGRWIELVYGPIQLLAIYLAAIIGGSLLSLWLHRNYEYRAYGASGGVCGLIFSFVFLFPGASIGVPLLSGLPIPVSIPAWLYAVIFLLSSFFALKRNTDNIGHDAHLGGAIIGLLTAAALHPAMVRLSPKWFAGVTVLSIALFVYLVKNPMFLPMASFQPRVAWPRFRKSKSRDQAVNRPDPMRVDAVLEKISRSGLESLTPEERRLLESVSARYRRRGESEKPESGLII
jgi:membrane associated rhomboid family serine protease